MRLGLLFRGRKGLYFFMDCFIEFWSKIKKGGKSLGFRSFGNYRITILGILTITFHAKKVFPATDFVIFENYDKRVCGVITN